MGLLTEKYKAWAKYPEKYTTKQVLDQIIEDLEWLDKEDQISERVKVHIRKHLKNLNRLRILSIIK